MIFLVFPGQEDTQGAGVKGDSGAVGGDVPAGAGTSEEASRVQPQKKKKGKKKKRRNRRDYLSFL